MPQQPLADAAVRSRLHTCKDMTESALVVQNVPIALEHPQVLLVAPHGRPGCDTSRRLGASVFIGPEPSMRM